MLSILIPAIGILAAIAVASWACRGDRHTLASWAAVDQAAALREAEESRTKSKAADGPPMASGAPPVFVRGVCAVAGCRFTPEDGVVMCPICRSLVTGRSKDLFLQYTKHGIADDTKAELGLSLIREVTAIRVACPNN